MTVYYCDGYGFSWLAIGMQQWGVFEHPDVPHSANKKIKITLPIAVTRILSIPGGFTFGNGTYGVYGISAAMNVTNTGFEFDALLAAGVNADRFYASSGWFALCI